MKMEKEVLIFGDAVAYSQAPNSKLAYKIESKTMTLDEDGLRARGAKIWGADGKSKIADWGMKTSLNPRVVLDRYLKPSQISFWNLPKFIMKMNDIGINPRGHLLQFWTLLFLPLMMIAMTTLGVAFSQTRERRNFHFGTKFSIGIVVCFAFYFITNVFNALGATGALPVLLAVLAPPLIIIALSGIAIVTFDSM
jgi:lipopolysaccharide export system permease protein